MLNPELLMWVAKIKILPKWFRRKCAAKAVIIRSTPFQSASTMSDEEIAQARSRLEDAMRSMVEDANAKR